jgi:hypothetical protein
MRIERFQRFDYLVEALSVQCERLFQHDLALGGLVFLLFGVDVLFFVQALKGGRRQFLLAE